MLTQLDPRMATDLSLDQLNRLIASNPPTMSPDGEHFFTGAVRLSFASLDKATVGKQPRPGQKPKYQATGLFPHRNVGAIHAALTAKVRQFYPHVTDPNVLLDPMNKNHPLRDQGLKVSTKDGGFDGLGKTYQGWIPGLPWVAAKSEQPPKVYHVVLGQVTEIVIPDDRAKLVPSGSWVSMKLRILKSTDAGNPGLFLGLQGLTKLASDRAFGGGGGASADDFAGAVAIEDPNGSSAGGGIVPVTKPQVSVSAWD